MHTNTKTWIGQVTTGHGFMVLAPTLIAALSGTMNWTVAAPLLLAGVVGLAWPENRALKDATQTAAADLEAVYARYQTNVVSAAVNAPQPPDPRNAAAAIAVLAAIGFSLTACADQTPAQQAAEMKAIACLANTAGKVALSIADPAYFAVETANAATAVGTELLTDPACQVVPASAAVPAKP